MYSGHYGMKQISLYLILVLNTMIIYIYITNCRGFAFSKYSYNRGVTYILTFMIFDYYLIIVIGVTIILSIGNNNYKSIASLKLSHKHKVKIERIVFLVWFFTKYIVIVDLFV